MSASRHIRKHKHNVKKGIQFCLMVCGASGTGRTTFVNTLCEQKVLPAKLKPEVAPEEAHVEQGVTIEPVSVELDLGEESHRISLTVVDTPGFGDLINNDGSFAEISGYLEQQYDDILAEETKVKRNPRFKDNRVHVLLYFIAPTGHGLRELDIELMGRLSKRVNVIPVIGKADSLTPAEVAQSKSLIMEDIENNRIPIYNFPYDVEEDDEETVAENTRLRGLLPFAIIGSEDLVKVQGTRDSQARSVRGRQYPWGCVEVENPEHCDFAALRTALFESHLGDLKEITHDCLYEDWRTHKLSSQDFGVQNTALPGENYSLEKLSEIQEQLARRGRELEMAIEAARRRLNGAQIAPGHSSEPSGNN